MKPILILFLFIPTFIFGQAPEKIQAPLPSPHEQISIDSKLSQGIAVFDNIAVVGAPGYDNFTYNGGGIFVYEYSGGAWNLINTLSETLPESQFGLSLAINDNYIVVGAPGTNANSNSEPGAVVVYKKPAEGWSGSPTSVTITDSNIDQNLGLKVAIAGNTVSVLGIDNGDYTIGIYEITDGSTLSFEVLNQLSTDGVTAPTFYALDMSDAVIIAGFADFSRAIVYAKKNDDWSQAPIQSEISDNTAYGFGSSVSIKNNTVAVSNSFEFNNDDDDGIVYLYENTLDDWTKLVNTNTLYPDLTSSATVSTFGMNVDLVTDSTLLVTGNYYEVPEGAYYLSLFTYTNDFGGSWANAPQNSRLALEQGFIGEASLSGSTQAVAVGNFNQTNSKGNTTGAGYLFDVNIDHPNYGAVHEVSGTDHATTFTSAAKAGFSETIALSNQKMAVGAPFSVVDGYDKVGKIYLYDFINGNWVFTQLVHAPITSKNIEFGASVDIYGQYLVTASQLEKKVYVFDLDDLDNAQNGLVATLTPSNPAEVSNSFGKSIEITNGYIFVGNDRKQKLFSTEGAVFIYKKPASGWADMTESNTIENPDIQSFTFFGAKIIHSDGLLFVGQPNFNSATQDNEGKINVYSPSVLGWENGYTLVNQIAGETPTEEGFLGRSFAVNNGLMAAWQEDKVYIYQRESNWYAHKHLYTHNLDFFSAASNENHQLAIHKQTVHIGVGNYSATAQNAGAVVTIAASEDQNWTSPIIGSLEDNATNNDFFGTNIQSYNDHLVIAKLFNSEVDYRAGAIVAYGNIPTATITQVDSDVEGQYAFELQFNQDVVGFDVDMITVIGGSISSSEAIDELTTKVLVQPGLANTFSIELPAGVVSNSSGYWNKASNKIEIVITGLDNSTWMGQIGYYPNPTVNTLQLTFNWEGKTTTTVQVFDLLGNLYQTRQSQEKTMDLPMQHLENGVYIIKVSNHIGETNLRIIKN